jgi:hypothetical protein
MRISSVAEWLKSHDLERFAQIFEQNEVDLTTLRVLTESDFKELGIPFGPRKRILSLLSEERAVEKLSDLGGYVVAPIGERRQLTVLFCDLVGFTKLAYKHDPEALQIIIRSYEQACASCVNRYEGYVFRMLGDGVVAFFGFPLAHESEAERAIRTALDIIEAMRAAAFPKGRTIASPYWYRLGCCRRRPRRAERRRRGAQSLGASANNRGARVCRRERQCAPARGR